MNAPKAKFINPKGIVSAEQAGMLRIAHDLSVLVQPEMEKRRSPFVRIPPLRCGDFQGMRVYRPMTSSCQRATRDKDLPRCEHRLDESTGLSLGMVASPQCPLPFRPAGSL